MTYASDKGLLVGSKIKILEIDEIAEFFKKGDILTFTQDDGTSTPWFNGGDYDRPMHLPQTKWEHYREPKLVWKEMSLEEVRAVQVGDKIRIDGVENEVTYTYNKVSDFGFRTNKERVVRGHNIINSSDVADMLYKFEQLVEETGMNTRLERDLEYYVKLTGEEIAIAALVLGKTTGTIKTPTSSCVLMSAYRKFKIATIGEDGTFDCSSSGVKTTGLNDFNHSWFDKIFTVPETEDQRKLRELKEQYESLGKAIDAMEKK